jgi:hypothetical protein
MFFMEAIELDGIYPFGRSTAYYKAKQKCPVLKHQSNDS